MTASIDDLNREDGLLSVAERLGTARSVGVLLGQRTPDARDDDLLVQVEETIRSVLSVLPGLADLELDARVSGVQHGPEAARLRLESLAASSRLQRGLAAAYDAIFAIEESR